MPRKLRKGRRKYKAQSRPKSSVLKEATQRPRAIPSRQAPVAKPQTTIAQLADRHRQAIAELKRISLIAAILLVLLIILIFLLR